jgi:hypothetical protein
MTGKREHKGITELTGIVSCRCTFWEGPLGERSGGERTSASGSPLLWEGAGVRSAAAGCPIPGEANIAAVVASHSPGLVECDRRASMGGVRQQGCPRGGALQFSRFQERIAGGRSICRIHDEEALWQRNHPRAHPT